MEAAIRQGKQPGQIPVDINETPRGAEGQSPLMMAIAASGRVEIASALIEAGADLNHHDDNGYSMLDVACLLGRHETVTLLLEKGADPTLPGPDGWAPIQWAANGRSPSFLKALQAIIEHDRKLAKFVDNNGVPILLYTRQPEPQQLLLDAGGCVPSWFTEADLKDSCNEIPECAAVPHLSGMGKEVWEAEPCSKLIRDLLNPTPPGIGPDELRSICPCSCGSWALPPLCDPVPESEMIGTMESQREHFEKLIENDNTQTNRLNIIMPNGLSSKKPQMMP